MKGNYTTVLLRDKGFKFKDFLSGSFFTESEEHASLTIQSFQKDLQTKSQVWKTWNDLEFFHIFGVKLHP